MSEVLSITLYSRSFLSPAEFLELLESYGYRISLQECQVFSNWEYDNLHSWTPASQDPESLEKVQEGILDSKIGMVRFASNDSYHNCGYYAWQLHPALYEIEVWISTLGLEDLQGDGVRAENRAFYDRLTGIVSQVGSQLQFLAAGIGLESRVEYHEKVEDLLENSSNVFRWILPNRPASKPANYKITQLQENWVLDRVQPRKRWFARFSPTRFGR